MKTQEFYDETYVSPTYQKRREDSLDSEIQFLLTYLPVANKNISIFDQCCGHGRHLESLYDNGYENLSGLDSNAYFISIAKQTLNKHVKLYTSDIFKFEMAQKTEFIINMGSAICGFTKENLDKIFGLNSKTLQSGGIFIIHEFNPFHFAKHVPRKTWIEVPSRGFIMEDWDIEFEKSSCNISQIRMMVDSEGKYEGFKTNLTITLHSKIEILNYGLKYGFKIKDVCGCFNGTPYDENTSKDMIFVFIKL
jgi:SAM-dependent methyltransferase